MFDKWLRRLCEVYNSYVSNWRLKLHNYAFLFSISYCFLYARRRHSITNTNEEYYVVCVCVYVFILMICTFFARRTGWSPKRDLLRPISRLADIGRRWGMEKSERKERKNIVGRHYETSADMNCSAAQLLLFGKFIDKTFHRVSDGWSGRRRRRLRVVVISR